MVTRAALVERAAVCAGLGALTALAALTALTALAVTAGGGQSAEPRSIRDGVFTARQAEQGRELFDYICASCHEIEELTGAGAYLDEMRGKSVWEMFDYVTAEMPEDDPGSLDADEYAAVLSYVFTIYGMPSGEGDLPTTRRALETIDIAPPSTPGG